MLKIISLALGALLVVFLGYVALQPSDYRIAQEITIQASPEKIFPHLENSKLMNEWSPWKDIDPAAQMKFSGPEAGVGAKTSWEGGKHLGKGSATVTEVVPNERVHTHLEYFEPFQGTQEAELTLKPAGEGTIVTWSVTGENNFVGRLMCTLMNMNKEVEKNFQQGLTSLKARVEKGN